MNRMLLAIVLLVSTAQAHADWKPDFQAWVGGAAIVSDMEEVQGGFSFVWDHVAVDMSHGFKRTSWFVRGELDDWDMNEWQTGSNVTMRLYPFDPTTVRPVIVISHSSDITRGIPFNDTDEPTSDFIGAGLTFDFKRVETELLYGRQMRECGFFDCPPTNVDPRLMVRFRFIVFGADK